MKHNLSIHSLRKMLSNMPMPIEEIKKKLDDFRCRKDKDIENFLRFEAIKYERTGKARTYLITDDANGVLIGYFTLSINSITFDKGIDSKVKKILDYEADRKQFKYMKKPFVPAILLALFGKDDNKFKEYLLQVEEIGVKRLSDIVFPAIFKIARQVSNVIGGQVIYLDCEKDKKLIKFYENFNFTHFRNNEYDKNLTQMMRVIN